MSPSALRLALQLRQAAVAAAQQHLAKCIEVEMQAATAARHANAAIQHEADAAGAANSDDAAVEAFAAWLPLGRTAQAVAAARHAASLDATDVARAGLAVARAAEAKATGALESYAARQLHSVQLRIRSTGLRAGVATAAPAAPGDAGRVTRPGWRNFLRW